MAGKGPSSPQLTPQGTCNVPDFILMSIGRFKDKVAQVDARTKRSITFSEIIGRVVKLEKLMTKSGINKGDVVAILLKNSIDYSWIMLGCLASRATCALLNPSATSRELRHYMDLVKPKVVIAEELTDEQFSILTNEKSVKKIYTDYKEHDRSKRITSYSDIIRQTAVNQELHKKHSALFAPTLNESALLLTSSGTTGLPKAVVLSHKNLIAALEQSGQFMRYGAHALGLMPFFHAYGLCLMLMALCEGTTLVALQRFSMDSLLGTISSFKITHLYLVPSIVISLGKSGEADSQKLSSVREVMTGAGPITYQQQMLLKKKLHGSARIFHSYGMTESTFVITFAEMREYKGGSIGKVVDGFKVEVLKENGEPAAVGESGELYVRGLMVFKGYLNNPEATEESLDSMKRLRTGDVVRKDDDGYFYHIERKKEFIKYQGFQISPTEIEMTLLQFPSVKDAAVIGINHDIFGEVPMAFIVKGEGGEVNERALINYVKQELSPYKQLRGGIRLVESIPRSCSGKVKRPQLKQMYLKDDNDHEHD